MQVWNKLPPLARVSLRYGALAGVIGFGLLLILYYMGRHPFLVPVFFDFRILLFGVFIFFSLKELRDYWQGGELFFWQGMIGSFLFTFVFAITCSSLLFLLAHFNQEFVTSFISLTLEQTKTFSPEEIEQIGRKNYEAGLKALQSADAYFLASRYFFQSFVISFFISLILSVILRRQSKID